MTIFIGTPDNDTLFGTEFDDEIFGQAGNDLIFGSQGNDTVNGGEGQDTYSIYGNLGGSIFTDVEVLQGDSVSGTVAQFASFQSLDVGGMVLTDGGDVDVSAKMSHSATFVLSTEGNYLIATAYSDAIFGGSSDDGVYAGDGDDYVAAGDGDDVVEGGAGNDTIWGGGGLDYLGGAVGNDVLEGGDGNDYLNGGEGDDLLRGGEGHDRLAGGFGINILEGGQGDDIYTLIDTDTVVEWAGEGIDHVYSSVSYTLGENVENLTLSKSKGAGIHGTGNALNNVITGSSGTNVLTGGLGNDTYYVQDIVDTVVETKKQGTDTVFSSVSFSIATTHVENLILSGGGHNNATGNAYNNILTGNAGNNFLTGALGDDTYYVQNVDDVVVEVKKEGTDTVMSSVSFSIATTHVENLTLTGMGQINATGNAYNNIITGNDASNILTGALGDDTYVVQNTDDVVFERRDEGTDTVMASVDYSIAAQFVENLTLTGTGDLSATGNNFRNTLIGNDGDNRLDGGLNKDILTGGLGADLFVFGLNSGKDVITDFDATENDAIDISAYTMGLNSAGMVYQFGLDVVINLPGDNRIIVSNASQADVLGQIIW